jgi:hypothetical protein
MGVVLDRFVFEQLEHAIETKGRARGELHGRLTVIHGRGAAVAIRRLLDYKERRQGQKSEPVQRTYSLVVLLREMAVSNQLLTRRSFVQPYNRVSRGQLGDAADRRFDKCAGVGKQFMPRSVIVADLRRLERIKRQVKPLVDKAIAHADRNRGRLSPRTIEDLHEALSVIEEVLLRYYFLLTRGDPGSLLPSRNCTDIKSDIYHLINCPEATRKSEALE